MSVSGGPYLSDNHARNSCPVLNDQIRVAATWWQRLNHGTHRQDTSYKLDGFIAVRTRGTEESCQRLWQTVKKSDGLCHQALTLHSRWPTTFDMTTRSHGTDVIHLHTPGHMDSGMLSLDLSTLSW